MSLPDAELAAWREHPQADQAVLNQVERDRADGERRCVRCGDFDSEHRARMFVGTFIDHDWCFTCHHVRCHMIGEMSRADAHHAFEAEARPEVSR